ncbi:ABC transporter family substrate-binding protein [Nocardiopsis sp. L17-MgMaSL7]|uniref:ABC transporter family substrate-binding protein n=2 Tax=Nocardiopsis TaxID=2013 RepID=UPI0004761ED0|nr:MULTISPECIES: ABC transporter family substrate-binding protein [Nocardiopsis]PWV58178.1 peptide/nickel transport system substrate-binding protein [Nocardiopsis sp. L17-MgMaSL7]
MRIGKARYLAPVAALVLLASACASDDGQSEDDAREEQASLAAEDLNPADRDDLQDGGDFVWALSEYEEQHNMNHVQGNKGDVRRVIAAVMPSASRYDAEGGFAPNEDYVLEYGVSDDGLEVDYTLNPDAVWSDGEPITWEDYEATVITRKGDRDGDFEILSTTGYEWIDEIVQGDDEHSFTLKMKEPYGEWPTLFSPLYPKEYMEDEELFADGYNKDIPVTAGPFGDVEFDDVASRITVHKNEDWWGDEAKLDRIIFAGLDTSAQAGAFANGEVDGFYLGYDAAGYERVKDMEGDGAYFTRAVNHGHRFTALNGSSPRLEDKRVRQAIAMTLDRDTMAEVALGAVDWPITGEVNRLLRSSQNGYQDNSGDLGDRDLDRAAELLDEAGWTLEEGEEIRTNEDGETLTLAYVASEGMDLAVDEGEMAQQMLAEVGIEVDVQQVPANALFSEYVTPGNYEMVTYVLVGTSPFSSTTKGNYGMPLDEDGEDWGANNSKHSTPEIEELFDELAIETDPERYAEIANEIDALLWDEVVTIPLFERPGLYVVNEDLHNWGEYGLAADYVYEDIGWAKED